MKNLLVPKSVRKHIDNISLQKDNMTRDNKEEPIRLIFGIKSIVQKIESGFRETPDIKIRPKFLN